MNGRFAIGGILALVLGLARPAPADDGAEETKAKVGKPAPDFTLPDTDGNKVTLSSFRGRIVILQWINPGCPVCKRVITEGVARKMLAEVKAIAEDAVFLPISTTAGMNPAKIAAYLKENGIEAKGLMDLDGTVGRKYDARTTPHLFVIDKEGVLRYQGAIDNDPAGKKPDPENYVVKAVRALVAGQPVSPETTKPYGCSVKYGK